ncbi:MAG: CRTAC1 family protein [Candidatus Caenarcaniphilales bacterium]|nr:CRTAC1 family protein [Candidatus Caenarcaniphilales bacterium]
MKNPKLFLVLLILLSATACRSKSPDLSQNAMFEKHTELIKYNPAQLNYGMAVIDLDQDGEFEVLVAGFGFPNLALKWDGRLFQNIADTTLADTDGMAIGVGGCDIDADGVEEVYILNTDTFGGKKHFGDRLLDYINKEWIDLFSKPENKSITNLTAGRSVVCLDRDGDGKYGIFVASYGGAMKLYEVNSEGRLEDVARKAHLALVTGGRGLIALPILSDHATDLFAVNEGGSNYLFRNLGDGTFAEIARTAGVSDPMENGRGVAPIDFNEDGRFDLVYGNWEGAHRLFIQQADGTFVNIADKFFAKPSRVRTVIVADFDNDGYEEIFFNNIGEPNRLFAKRDGKLMPLNPGDALEPESLGTGGAVGDFNHDGMLELFISHGESGREPISYFRVKPNSNHWLRVLPLTKYGAPARGAVVHLKTADRLQIRAIDAGSGYLCQMEPVAHFGLGATKKVEEITVTWSDGHQKKIFNPDVDQMIKVSY